MMNMQAKQDSSSFSAFMMGIAVGVIGALILKDHKTQEQTKEFLDSLSDYLKTKLNSSNETLPPFNSTDHPLPPKL
jgi:hypothetical protein